MKTSYNEACARDCSTLEKDLALCEKVGFDYIEIRLDLLRGWLKEHTVEQLKEFFETHRLKPHAINAVYLHQGMLPDETPDWDDPAMQDFKLACEVGSAIGSGYVIIVPPLDPSGVFTGDAAAGVHPHPEKALGAGPALRHEALLRAGGPAQELCAQH